MSNTIIEQEQSCPAEQQPIFNNKTELNNILNIIEQLPEIVPIPEIHELQQHLAAAGRGEKIIIHAGDCAESFADCDAEKINNKIKLLTNLQKMISKKLNLPSICIGRIAGQYAKPRSETHELSDGISSRCSEI